MKILNRFARFATLLTIVLWFGTIEPVGVPFWMPIGATCTTAVCWVVYFLLNLIPACGNEDD